MSFKCINIIWTTCITFYTIKFCGRLVDQCSALRQTHPCNACGQLGHWANDCRQRWNDPVIWSVTCLSVAPTRVYMKNK